MVRVRVRVGARVRVRVTVEGQGVSLARVNKLKHGAKLLQSGAIAVTVLHTAPAVNTHSQVSVESKSMSFEQ